MGKILIIQLDSTDLRILQNAEDLINAPSLTNIIMKYPYDDNYVVTDTEAAYQYLSTKDDAINLITFPRIECIIEQLKIDTFEKILFIVTCANQDLSFEEIHSIDIQTDTYFIAKLLIKRLEILYENEINNPDLFVLMIIQKDYYNYSSIYKQVEESLTKLLTTELEIQLILDGKLPSINFSIAQLLTNITDKLEVFTFDSYQNKFFKTDILKSVKDDILKSKILLLTKDYYYDTAKVIKYGAVDNLVLFAFYSLSLNFENAKEIFEEIEKSTYSSPNRDEIKSKINSLKDGLEILDNDTNLIEFYYTTLKIKIQQEQYNDSLLRLSIIIKKLSLVNIALSDNNHDKVKRLVIELFNELEHFINHQFKGLIREDLENALKNILDKHIISFIRAELQSYKKSEENLDANRFDYNHNQNYWKKRISSLENDQDPIGLFATSLKLNKFKEYNISPYVNFFLKLGDNYFFLLNRENSLIKKETPYGIFDIINELIYLELNP